MAIALAVGTALGWGASDFFGGAARRATPVFVIVAAGELLGLVVLIPVLLARGIPLPHSPRLLFASAAGLGVTVELGVIYLALSRGEAFITAPVGAAGAALAVIFGIIGGDPIDITIAVGLLCALLGGALSASTPTSRNSRHGTLRSTGLAAGAAGGVAAGLICLHAAGRVDPTWATATEHTTTAISAGLVASVPRGTPFRQRFPKPRQLPAITLVGLTGLGGDLAYATASQHGALTSVSAISSLYPITTIALSIVIQHHRPERTQGFGIVLALIGAATLGAATP